ncbi:MAG: nucleotidyltransferase domain-containing protein [Chlorobi bacterium]|nr:nucleotidyltransferase domain-containing protein [Chlorobiota bacterium]
MLKRAGCSEIYLFGSYLTNEYNDDSDINL